MPYIKPTAIVFSKGKPEQTWTADWIAKCSGFDRSKITYVVSDGDDVTGYKQSTGCRVIVATGTRSLSQKRQWATDNLYKSGDWVFAFEDNIQRVTGVLPKEYHHERFNTTTRGLFHDREYSIADVLRVMEADHKKAAGINALFGGFACNDNHFFRKRKYRTVGFVWTKMCYWKAGAGPVWPAHLKEMDDYGYTAECLSRTGRVLINNFLYPWAKRYEGRGGSRTLEERAPDKRIAAQDLVKRFPELYCIRDRKGYPEGTELRTRMCTEKQADRWLSTIHQKETNQ